MKYNLFWAIVVAGMCVQAKELPLPNSLLSKAIFYTRCTQLDAYCCGYNALFNACNIEDMSGFANRFALYKNFDKKVSAFLRAKNQKPKANANSTLLEELARSHLAMQPLTVIGYVNNDIRLATLEIVHPYGASKKQIEEIFVSTGKTKTFKKMQELKGYLASRTNALVHFICCVHVRGESHGILISIMQNATGRALYIFDNMNMQITHDTEIKKCIDFLAYTFAISNREDFHGKDFPSRWPSLPETNQAMLKNILDQLFN